MQLIMPIDEDWSDSDEEVLSDAETSVQLGLPDGPIESSDMFDAAVSRIGGHPVRDIFRRRDVVPVLNILRFAIFHPLGIPYSRAPARLCALRQLLGSDGVIGSVVVSSGRQSE